MKSKVRNYILEPVVYDTHKGTYFKKKHTETSINIFFDEDMYIDKLSEKEFSEEFKNILKDCLNRVNSKELLYNIESKINSLIIKYRDTNSLFLEKELYFKDKTNMLILQKEIYFDEY